MTVKGYDSVLQSGLLLDFAMKEGSGVKTQDWAKGRHPTVLTGTPAWTQLDNDVNVLDFDPTNPDRIKILQANSVDLNFTTGPFTVSFWFNPDRDDVTEQLVCRGGYITQGWEIFRNADNEIVFRTNQAFDSQATYSTIGSVLMSNWYFVVVTRTGSTAKVYINGVDRTGTTSSHTNPVSSTKNFIIGTVFDEASLPYDGLLGRTRIWNRALSKDEIESIFEIERGRYDV